jgi:hypothetical protein
MKILLPFIFHAMLVCDLLAATVTEELNPKLLAIFEQMQSEAGASELEGKTFQADLTLRIATERFLVFSDAYLQVDEDTRYQIGKWMFDPEQIAALKLKRDDRVTVTFKIEAIRTAAPYADMPHFVATEMSIVPLKKEVDTGEGGNSE